MDVYDTLDPPKQHAARHGAGWLRPTENRQNTLIVGGIKQKRTERISRDIPLLCGLPAVGPWFTYRRDQVVEEELLLIVAPRIADRQAK